jgi:hypothetical protein
MAEAEALADDIHVLVEGQLVASGSSSSLKAQYGWGYTLKVVLERQLQQQSRLTNSYVSIAAAAATRSGGVPADETAAAAEQRMAAAAVQLMLIAQQHIPTAELLSAAGAELSFRIPQGASEAAAGLLESIVASHTELGVASYTFSNPTQQEVRRACCLRARCIQTLPCALKLL